VIPNPVEWILLFWLSGNLVSELTSVGGGSGLGIVKVIKTYGKIEKYD
jgi:hypothetical protein